MVIPADLPRADPAVGRRAVGPAENGDDQKQENITSIADFIAARYGKSQSLAVVVALICLVGVLPYIALQLKGIVLGVNLLIGAGADAMGTRAQDTALIVSLVLALFTIVFGTRNLDATEHHRGMVLAIAFESLVKLFAFLAVGAFVTYGLYDGFDDLFNQAMLAPRLEEYWKETINWPSMVVQTGVAMMAIICLPRQFHVTVVENIDPQDLRLAKWVFPAYLALAALFVVPIAPWSDDAAERRIARLVVSVCRWRRPIRRWQCWRLLAAHRRPPAWSLSPAWRCRPWSQRLLCRGCCGAYAERPFEVFRSGAVGAPREHVVIRLLAYVSYRLLGSTASLATIGQCLRRRDPLAPPCSARCTGTGQPTGVFAGSPPAPSCCFTRGFADCGSQPRLVAEQFPGAGVAAQYSAEPADQSVDPRRGVVAGR